MKDGSGDAWIAEKVAQWGAVKATGREGQNDAGARDHQREEPHHGYSAEVRPDGNDAAAGSEAVAPSRSRMPFAYNNPALDKSPRAGALFFFTQFVLGARFTEPTFA